MNAFVSLRRIALVMALLALAVPASAAQAGDFSASGTFVPTDLPGAGFELSLSGRAQPGGKFTGTGSGKAVEQGTHQYGELVLDFGAGNTLTLEVDTELDEDTGLLIGTYTITGGTGRLAGASGEGSCLFLPVPAGDTGTFQFDGTLSY